MYYTRSMVSHMIRQTTINSTNEILNEVQKPDNAMQQIKL